MTAVSIVGMRPDAEAAVRNAGPVSPVVTALPSGQRPIRDLVMHVARGLQPGLGFRVKRREILVARKRWSVLAPCAPLFDVQHVDGNVLGPQFNGLVQVFDPRLDPLARE